MYESLLNKTLQESLKDVHFNLLNDFCNYHRANPKVVSGSTEESKALFDKIEEFIYFVEKFFNLVYDSEKMCFIVKNDK